MGREVFISYSSRDREYADAVCHHLEAEGLRCWIAPRDMPVGTWGRQIVEAIKASRILVVVFSSHANGSVQVLREVERAVNYRLTIIPFRVEDVTPRDDLEYFLSAVHWLDAMSPPVERHIRALVVRVKATLSAEEEAARVERQEPSAAPDPAPIAGPFTPMPRMGQGPDSALRRRVWRGVSVAIAPATLGLLAPATDLALKLDLTPPWPDQRAAIAFTSLVSVVTFILARSLVGGPKAVRRGVIAAAAVSAAALVAYLALGAAFVWDTTVPHIRVVGGFVLKPAIRRVRLEMPEESTGDLLRGYGYDVDNIWEPWSIVAAGLGLLVSWLAFCAGVSTLVALLLKRLGANEAPGGEDPGEFPDPDGPPRTRPRAPAPP